RPRDAPGRTAFGAAFFTWVALIFWAGAADRLYLFLNWSYSVQIWVYRVMVVVAPLVVFFVTRRICRELQDIERVEHTREAAEHEAQEVARARPAGAPTTL
ncbi:MAG: hypothetical protein ACJ760_12345, partial [Thermoleophilaceae bacterium]